MPGLVRFVSHNPVTATIPARAINSWYQTGRPRTLHMHHSKESRCRVAAVHGVKVTPASIARRYHLILSRTPYTSTTALAVLAPQALNDHAFNVGA